jgi:hypothetical protein
VKAPPNKAVFRFYFGLFNFIPMKIATPIIIERPAIHPSMRHAPLFVRDELEME